MHSGEKPDRRILVVLRDAVKALLIGAAAGGVLATLFFLVGFVLGGISSGVESAKNVLFVCAAAALFLLAGMLLIKGKKPEKPFDKNGWRRHFAAIGPKAGIGVIAVAMILWAAVLDYVQLWMGHGA